MSAHSVPLHCPYCAGEDLHPHGERHGAWECRECLRAFSVSLIGQIRPRRSPHPTDSVRTTPAPATTGGLP
jgi:transposase-like protein